MHFTSSIFFLENKIGDNYFKLTQSKTLLINKTILIKLLFTSIIKIILKQHIELLKGRVGLKKIQNKGDNTDFKKRFFIKYKKVCQNKSIYLSMNLPRSRAQYRDKQTPLCLSPSFTLQAPAKSKLSMSEQILPTHVRLDLPTCSFSRGLLIVILKIVRFIMKKVTLCRKYLILSR